MNHLSDEILQKYLADCVGNERAEIDRHLAECSSCRQNLEIYRQLFVELNRPLENLLPSTFSAQVTARLKAVSNRRSRIFEWLFLLVGLLFSLTISLYLLNSRNIASSILRFLQNNLTWNTEILGLIKSFINRLNGNVDFILFAGALIILIAIIDRLISHSRLRMD